MVTSRPRFQQEMFMRTTLLASGLFLALAVVPGCKKDKKKADDKAADMAKPDMDKDTTPPPDPNAKPAGGGEGGGEGGGQDMTNKMMHCPSAAPGAETKVEQTKDAVVVTVTSKDKAAVTEIQTRSKYMAGLTAGGAPKVEHTGNGTGGGALGKCPVMMADVALKAENVKDGSKITLTPKDTTKLAEVAKTAQDRAAAMPAGGGAAGGKAAGEDDTPADEP
jgi:hypothetical protein